MSDIPRDRSFDSTLAFLSEGNSFISNRCRRLGSDVFETRIMLQRAYCTLGEEAVRLFYDEDPAVTRRDAMPITTLMLLQGRGSVQTLEDAPHRRRKEMFMALMTRQSIQRLAEIMAECWRTKAAGWANMEEVILHDEMHGVLCRAVCRWSGVPLPEAEVGQRTRELAAMISGAGAIGPRNWRGMALRTRSERWLRGIVRDLRSGRLDAAEGTAAHVIATHRDLDGNLLDEKTAAIELLNILRPVVAIARYIVFAAMALHEFPQWRDRLKEDDADLDGFVHEVRRWYPYLPVMGGRVRRAFEWRGHRFAEGDWMLLDLYGTNRDPRIWSEPEEFRPERFRQGEPGAFSLVPQGGGDFETSHRCAGEWVTIELMKTAVRLLVTGMHYDVPRQDLHIDMARIPAIPKSRFVITDVKPALDGPA